MRRSSRRHVFESQIDPNDGLAPSSSVVPFVSDRFGEASAVLVMHGVKAEDLPPELRNEIARVFGGAVLADPVKNAAIQDAAREFRHQGTKVLAAAVSMGRALIVLRREVGMPALVRAMRESRLIFCGWSQGNLSKMMRVAEFVDAGGYDLDVLPQSLGTTYELATLDSRQMEQARAGDLVRPDVTRSQLQEFKRRIPPEDVVVAVVAGEGRAELQLKLKALRKRHDVAVRRLEAAKADIRDMEARIAALGRGGKA